jgi:hypothetical protein
LLSSGDWQKIEGSLNTKLVETITEYPVILENQGGSNGGAIEAEDTHIEAWFLPATSETIEVFEDGKERAVGVYFVKVRTPRFVGKYDVNQIVDKVMMAFKRGTVLYLDGIKVRVTKVYPESSLIEGGFYVVPVTVNWQADL